MVKHYGMPIKDQKAMKMLLNWQYKKKNGKHYSMQVTYQKIMTKLFRQHATNSEC
jgi:hypothetical protein